ncbi:competence/damage-inducible protein A [Tyzzerella sp. An114]|uniref:competence/damage-inducible protein A n=1 Tax=Tyzzerella sp. An114 TaxID=1965545 RepID=UPI000B44DF3B|nr:competence/damage-inducible protein A [Tyzzerella sp. An114]OUQ58781.1 competence/damage-inducible protein A [Tyzzerella sp. An114]HIT72816.1 competence/damage-inducible protein A [Candidatus Fimicola cottocaccae]
MNAEILAVGTEILLGDIVNTNAQYLARELADLGIGVYYQTVVGDNPDRLRDTIYKAFSRADLIITTGGLGPTEDDLTKETGAKYFDKELVLDEKALDDIKEFFEKTGRKMTENNVKQAYVPEGSTVLYNENGTAPGIIIEENGKILIMLPGPPKETIPIFENQVKPFLKSKQEYTLVSRVLRVAGVGESKMETLVKDIIENSENPTVAPYAKDNEAILRITAKAHNEQEAMELIKPVADEIYNRLGDAIYGEGDTNLESVVAELLINKKMTISTSESCTGGLLAGTLIEYPGISSVFMDGVVSYSNESKMYRLGVKEETLEKYGAVSHETAAEMAKGIAETAGTNIGISTTGIAGPGGGSPEKPVGLVYVGICINGNVKTKEMHFAGTREKIRGRAVYGALNWLRKELLNLDEQ